MGIRSRKIDLNQDEWENVEAALRRDELDMVDSGGTLTVAAYLLKSHGSGPVYPLALAACRT